MTPTSSTIVKTKGKAPLSKIKKGIGIQLDCDFCGGPISGKTHVFKFANYERFFCCTECRSSYKQKYSGRIEALNERFQYNLC